MNVMDEKKNAPGTNTKNLYKTEKNTKNRSIEKPSHRYHLDFLFCYIYYSYQ